MSLSVRAKNPQGFANMLRQMGAALGESAMRKAGAAAASVVLKEAKARAPVGPQPHHQGKKKFPVGFGRDSLLVYFKPEKSSAGHYSTYTVAWSKDAYYLAFYEYGTSKKAARPWFRPAIEATRAKQKEAVREQLDKSLREAGIVI